MIYKNKTYLLLSELFASSLLADLMRFVVTTGCAVAAVVLALASDTFAAALAFLFRLREIL